MNSSPPPKETSTAEFFSIDLGSQLSELLVLNQWVEQVSSQANLSKEFCFKINLVLEEAVTNIIQHGFIDNQQGCIGISMRLNNYHMFIEIQDNGLPFNPLEDHTVVLPENLQDADVGGLGIHLMKSYSDDISYQRKDESNILKFRLSATL